MNLWILIVHEHVGVLDHRALALTSPSGPVLPRVTCSLASSCLAVEVKAWHEFTTGLGSAGKERVSHFGDTLESESTIGSAAASFMSSTLDSTRIIITYTCSNASGWKACIPSCQVMRCQVIHFRSTFRKTAKSSRVPFGSKNSAKGVPGEAKRT